MRKDSRGFSWLEVILVIAIVVLIVNILVPSIWSSKTQTNGMSAERSVRMIVSAEENYAQAYEKGYSSALSTLGPPPDGMPSSSLAGYVDSELAEGMKDGYSFVYTAGPADSNGRIKSYTLTANPSKAGDTGNTYYFVDETGVIRENMQHAATASDMALPGYKAPGS